MLSIDCVCNEKELEGGESCTFADVENYLKQFNEYFNNRASNYTID